MPVTKPLRINHPELGPVSARYSHDWDTGATVYDVTAPRVRGVFTLRLDPVDCSTVGQRYAGDPYGYSTHWLDPDQQQVRIWFGRPFPGHHPDWGAPDTRTDRPVVNAVSLVGYVYVNIDKLRRPEWPYRRFLSSADFIHMKRSTGGIRGDEEAPPATQERAALVMDGLVRHWAVRPENYALRLAACRYDARHSRVDVNVQAARERLTAAREELVMELAYARDVQLHAAAPLPGPPDGELFAPLDRTPRPDAMLCAGSVRAKEVAFKESWINP